MSLNLIKGISPMRFLGFVVSDHVESSGWLMV